MEVRELISRRLFHQMVCRQVYQKPWEVVQHMGAMQAQDYYASLLAVGLRISRDARATAKLVEKDIVKKKIVRTWPMRGTLHLVAATDVRAMLSLLTPRVIRSSAGRYRQLELDEAVFSKARGIIEKALAGGKMRTRLDIYLIFEKEGISTHGQRGIHILSHLAQKAVICFGPKLGKQPTFVLLDEWIPGANTFDPEESLAILTKRYFSSHGPATAHDFAAWAGLTVRDAKRGIGSVSGNLEKIKLQDRMFYFLPEKSVQPTDPEAAWLLPAFDEMLCGYRDKTDILPGDKTITTILRNGIIKPIIVAGAQVVGTWNWIRNRERKKLETLFFEELPEGKIDSVRKQAAWLEMFYQT